MASLHEGPGDFYSSELDLNHRIGQFIDLDIS